MKRSKDLDQPLPHQCGNPAEQTEPESAAQDPGLEIIAQDHGLQPRLLRVRQHLPFPLRHRHLPPKDLLQQQAIHGRVAEAHARMRTHQRERFADQQQPAVEERCSRGRTIADRRDEGFGGLVDELQKGGFEDVGGVGCQLGPHFRSHFPGRERVSMGVAVGVGHVFLEVRGTFGAIEIPDPV